MLQSKSYVYRFLNGNNQVIYIGKTNNLDKRYTQHFRKGHLPEECYDSVWKIEYIKENSELNALLLETYYINKYRPRYNKLNKTYRSVSTDNVNLKEIKDNWRIYKVINPSLTPATTSGRKLTFKENLFFYSLTAVSLLIVMFLYLK